MTQVLSKLGFRRYSHLFFHSLSLVITIAALPLAAPGEAAKGASEDVLPKEPNTRTFPANISNDALISQLQEIDGEGVGFDSTAFASGFMALDEEPVFRGGIIGSKKPQISPPLQELVRRGNAALPDLLEHVTDARSTKLTLGKGFMGKWFSDEYEARKSRENKPLKRSTERIFDNYTLKVGDLCFVAIGQIVNRSLNAVRYQPSMCLVINSPIETPLLAAAVREDWSGLQPSDHQHSLQEDAQRIPTSVEALKRLLFYYPEVGEPLVEKYLARPVFDRAVIENFLVDLRKEPEKTWPTRLKSFLKKRGEPNYLGILTSLAIDVSRRDSGWPGDRERKKVTMLMLHDLFPEIDTSHPPFINAMSVFDANELVDGLAAFKSQKIDEDVLDLFRRSISIEQTNIDDEFAALDLAVACAKRLTGREQTNESFESGFQKILAQFLKSKSHAPQSEGAANLLKQLEKLQKKQP